MPFQTELIQARNIVIATSNPEILGVAVFIWKERLVKVSNKLNVHEPELVHFNSRK